MAQVSEKVSVIVPTHNRATYLERTLRSLIDQTYPNTEIVVVDDNEPGSPARAQTGKLMESYCRSHPEIVYILNPHTMGGGLARNEGIKVCTGTYVTFLDDDDVFLPEKIEKQLEFTIGNDLDMSFTDVYLLNSQGKLNEFRRHTYVTDCSNSELLRQHILHSLGPTSTFMIKKEILLECGFRDVPMGQDFMLMLDLIEKGIKIGYLPKAFTKQYLHDGSRISTGKNKIDGENHLFDLKKSYFDLFSESEKRYIYFRHYAVLFFSCFRSGQPVKALGCGIRCFIISPKNAMNELNRRRANRRLSADAGVDDG